MIAITGFTEVVSKHLTPLMHTLHYPAASITSWSPKTQLIFSMACSQCRLKPFMIQNKIYHKLYTYFHKFLLQDTDIISVAKNGNCNSRFFSFWYFSDFFYPMGLPIAETVSILTDRG